METKVTSEGDGTTRTYVGIKVSDGPGRLRLLITRPYNDAGHVVEIPRESIKSIDTVPSRKFGDPA